MTVSAAIAELEEEFSQLEQVMNNLVWAVVQVRPKSEIGRMVAEHYESATTDFSGIVKEARRAAHIGRRASTEQIDQVAVRGALIMCQECANELVERYYGDIASFSRIADLEDLTKRGNRDWAKWVLGVRDGLSSCPQNLHSINQALLRCWQEITEPIGPLSVTAHATSFSSPIVIHSRRSVDTLSAEHQPDDSAGIEPAV